MEHTIQIKPEDFTASLVESLRKLFAMRHATAVTISYSVPDKTSLRDETQDEANRRIEAAALATDESAVTFSGDEFVALARALSGNIG
jgi:hypothetical protein